MAPAGATGIEEESIIAQVVARDKVSWWNKPNLRTLYLSLVPFCLMIESTSGIDSSLMNSFQALPWWLAYFDKPSKALTGFVVASYSLGAITAIPFVSLVTDHWGRRWSIVFGSAVMVTGALLQGFAQHIAMFIIARLILGHGIVYAIVSGAALLGELGHPKERHFLGAMFNAFYGVGSLLGAGIVCATYEIKSDWQWRIPGVLQALPSLIQIAFAFSIPESPRWLVSRDRTEEALEILIKYHAEGDASNELPHLEMAEIRKALEIENESRKKGWAELFQTQAMRRRTLVVFFIGLFTQFSGNNLISNYLTQILTSIGIDEKRTQLRYNVGTEAWGLTCAMIIANITPRYPRRRMYLLCASLLLLIYTGWTVAQERRNTTKSMAAGYTVLVFIYLYKPAYNIAYNALTYVYLVELLPYYVRTKGLSWFQFWGRASSTLGSQVNPIGFEDIGWKYLLVYIFWLAFEIVFIYFLFPETFGKTLEELTFLFESEKEGARALAATTAKVIQEPHVTEVQEVREDKKA